MGKTRKKSVDGVSRKLVKHLEKVLTPSRVKKSAHHPKVEQKQISTVVCVNCHQTQLDKGKSSTCSRCGYSPLPSYHYPKTSAFHPDFRRVKQGAGRVSK